MRVDVAIIGIVDTACNMSSRLYPLYQRGNPQLRVFLPNFTMFPVKTSMPRPSNVVTFQCSIKMTEFDVRNYLTKIYKLPVKHIKLQIEMGETKKALGKDTIVKDDDIKLAHITLDGVKFQFPDLYPAEKLDINPAETKEMQMLTKEYKGKLDQHAKDRPHVPSWFSV